MNDSPQAWARCRVLETHTLGRPSEGPRRPGREWGAKDRGGKPAGPNHAPRFAKRLRNARAAYTAGRETPDSQRQAMALSMHVRWLDRGGLPTTNESSCRSTGSRFTMVYQGNGVSGRSSNKVPRQPAAPLRMDGRWALNASGYSARACLGPRVGGRGSTTAGTLVCNRQAAPSRSGKSGPTWLNCASPQAMSGTGSGMHPQQSPGFQARSRGGRLRRLSCSTALKAWRPTSRPELATTPRCQPAGKLWGKAAAGTFLGTYSLRRGPRPGGAAEPARWRRSRCGAQRRRSKLHFATQGPMGSRFPGAPHGTMRVVEARERKGGKQAVVLLGGCSPRLPPVVTFGRGAARGGSRLHRLHPTVAGSRSSHLAWKSGGVPASNSRGCVSREAFLQGGLLCSVPWLHVSKRIPLASSAHRAR